jgi:hypothetical protein
MSIFGSARWAVGARGTNILGGAPRFYNVYETATASTCRSPYEPKFYANLLRLIGPLDSTTLTRPADGSVAVAGVEAHSPS